MANIKISQLPTASAITSDDLIPIVENGAVETQKADFSQVLSYITSSTFNTLEVTSLTASNLTVQGVLTAREFHTELVSASIIYQSGSTKFGDSSDDTHQFTGSVDISGTLAANGDVTFSSDLLTFGPSAGDAVIQGNTTDSLIINAKSTMVLNYDSDNDQGGSAVFYIGRNSSTDTGTRDLTITEGKVGIGIGLPSELLEVRNSSATVGEGARIGEAKIGTWEGGTSYAAFVHNSVHATANSYALLQSDLGETALNTATGRSLFFKNNNSTNMVINAAGNVGIGTTSPGTYKLNVNGTARAQQFYGTSDSNYYVEPDSTSYLKTTFFSTSPTGDYVEVSDTYIYGQGTVDSFNISSTGNSWLRSNVGIGTVSPSAYSVGARNLVITDASSDAGLTIHSSPTSQGRIYFSEAVSTGVASRRGQIVYDQNTDDMFFATTQTERMRIDSAGNVGIGTTNPSGKLDIVQSSTTPGLLLRNGDTSTGFTRPQIALSFNAGDQYRHFIHTRHDGGGPANNAIDFYVCNGTAVNSLTVGSTHNLTLEAGKVGIGTTSPSEKLEVVGNSIFSGSVEVSGTLRADVEVSGNITAASYTLSAADYGKTLLFSSSATQNITCSSGLDVGYNVTVIQAGTGQLNFSGSGVTLVNRFAHTSSAGQYSAVSVIVLNGTQYLVVGDTA